MTEQERYLFDLQGFLVVPNALSPATIDRLNCTMDAKIAESWPEFLKVFMMWQLLMAHACFGGSSPIHAARETL